MPAHGDAPLGAPIWIELFTSDPDATRPFYSELFGWTAGEADEAFGGYWTFSKGAAGIAGGIRNHGGGGPDGWSVYLAAPDAQAVADATPAAGGTVIVPPMPVGDLGTMVVLADPGGAAIGAWQPGTHRGFALAHEDGTPGWFELQTRAYEPSVAFYEQVFAWDAHTASDTPEFRYTTLFEGDAQEAGIMDASVWPGEEPAAWSIYFHCDDVDATLAKVVELGGTVTIAAEDTPYGRLAQAADPTGVRFKLMTPPA